MSDNGIEMATHLANLEVGEIILIKEKLGVQRAVKAR